MPVQGGNSQGPNNGSSFTNVGTGVQWANPGNVRYSDDTYASVLVPYLSTTAYLRATGFGFSIPSGVVITGIVVEIERRGDWITDNGLYLVKNGNAVGENKASPSLWPAQDEYETYGSSTDLWGVTWTPEDINSPEFGVQISAANGQDYDYYAYIDHIAITVYYSDYDWYYASKLVSRRRPGRRR